MTIPNTKPTSRSLAVAKGDLLVLSDLDGHAEWFAVGGVHGGRFCVGSGKSADYEELTLLRLNTQPDREGVI